MLHYIVFLIFFVFLLRKFENTAIMVAAMACWLTFFRDPLNLVDNVYLVLSLLIVLLGVKKYGKSLKKAPFIWCIVPVFVSYVVTMFAHGVFLKQYLIIIAQYLFPCVLYLIINSRAKVNLFVKYASAFMILVTVYCFIEEIISSNPFISWCEDRADSFTFFSNKTDERFGFKRAQSIFASPTGLGIMCSYLFVTLFIFLRNNEQQMRVVWRKALLIFMPICVFFTGTRSIILCFLLAVMTLLTPSTIRKYRTTFISTAIILCVFLSSYFISIYDSIFVDTEIGGSSSEMREGQWEIAFYYMMNDFWVGNGFTFTSSLLNNDEAGLFGAEGMWLPIIMDRGMIGVISVALAFIIGLSEIIKRKYYRLIWLWVSFLVLKTITTGVGIEPTYYAVILVVLFRYNEFKKLENLHKGRG